MQYNTTKLWYRPSYGTFRIVFTRLGGCADAFSIAEQLFARNLLKVPIHSDCLGRGSSSTHFPHPRLLPSALLSLTPVPLLYESSTSSYSPSPHLAPGPKYDETVPHKSSDRIVKMEVGVEIFCRWGVERRGRGSKFFSTRVEKEVGVEFCHKL